MQAIFPSAPRSVGCPASQASQSPSLRLRGDNRYGEEAWEVSKVRIHGWVQEKDNHFVGALAFRVRTRLGGVG